VSESKGDLGLVPAFDDQRAARGGPRWNSKARRRSSRGCRSSTGPTTRRRCNVFVVSRAAADAMVTEVESWSVRVAGWGAAAAARPPLAEIVAVPDRAFDGAALLFRCRPAASSRRSRRLVKAGASVRSTALVGSHATRYNGAVRKGLNAITDRTCHDCIDPRPARACLRSTPMCRARARRRASTRSSSYRPTETPLGPSPKAIAAYQASRQASPGLSDGSASDLREAIGRVFGLDPDRIVCGAGSDDLLNLIARAYLSDGDEAIHTTARLLVYPIATLGTGANARGGAGEGVHRRRRLRSFRA
jgi:hypothetical protein